MRRDRNNGALEAWPPRLHAGVGRSSHPWPGTPFGPFNLGYATTSAGAAGEMTDAVRRQVCHRRGKVPNRKRAETVSEETTRESDFVVVGGGAAGCVLAARLSQDPGCQVLLLEACPSLESAMISTPGAALGLLGSDAMYGDATTPQARRPAWSIPLPTGRGLGGGSAVNTLTWFQGHPADYDGWRHRWRRGLGLGRHAAAPAPGGAPHPGQRAVPWRGRPDDGRLRPGCQPVRRCLHCGRRAARPAR